MAKISIKKNFLYSMAYQILILITPFITAPYVSRVLGADGVGIYSYTVSIVSYFTLFGALGTASYGAREIAQHRDDRKACSKLFWEIEIMTVFTSGAALAVWIFVIFFSSAYRYYFIALIPMILATMFDISWFYIGQEQMKYNVIRNSLCKIAGIVLLFVLVRDKDDVIVYTIINSVISLVGNVSMWTYLPKFVDKVSIKTMTFRKHFKETLVYFIPTIATSIYTVLDKTLIGVITKDEFENGYYEQATKLINIVKALVFTSVNTVVGARISYLFAGEHYEEIHRRIEDSLDFIMFMGYACAFGIVGVARNFVPLFFGEGYGPVVPLLYIFAPIIIIIGISNCLGSQYYTPSGQRARSAKFIITGSAVNLVLNLCMIPKLGCYGAAVASVLAELTITILYTTCSDGYMSLKIILRCSWKRILAGAVMCAAVMAVGEFINLPSLILLIVQVIVGAAIYLGLLLLMRDQMIKRLRSMVSGKLKRRRG